MFTFIAGNLPIKEQLFFLTVWPVCLLCQHKKIRTILCVRPVQLIIFLTHAVSSELDIFFTSCLAPNIFLFSWVQIRFTSIPFSLGSASRFYTKRQLTLTTLYPSLFSFNSLSILLYSNAVHFSFLPPSLFQFLHYSSFNSLHYNLKLNHSNSIFVPHCFPNSYNFLSSILCLC